MTCQQCGDKFQVLGKRATHSKRPAKFCSHRCYADSKKGLPQDARLIGRGGAPRGRVPWNRGKQCSQLAGENNGMHGQTHTPEVKALLSAKAVSDLSALTNRLANAGIVPLPASDPAYEILFRRGWEAVRERALRRDQRTCQDCGTAPRRPDVHHITPFCLVVRHDLDNLVTLCRSCHQKRHRLP
jgi:hypothetical protein